MKDCLIANDIWSMLQDTKGNLWFGIDGDGLRRYDGKTFTTFTVRDGLADNDVGCILQENA